MHNHWWEDAETPDRRERMLEDVLNRMREIEGAPLITPEDVEASGLHFDFESGQIEWPKCGDPEPPWWNHPEEDVDYTSTTAFALLGVLLGNTLEIDLKPLLKQARAIKLIESGDDIEF